MELKDVIRIRRKELGLSLEQIGQACGVGKSIVAKWERGEVTNIRRDNIAALADALHVSPLVIVGRQDLDGTPPGMEPYHPHQVAPVLGRVAAGLPMYAAENIEGYVPIDYPAGEQYYALRVHGDSMTAAQISDGDLVIVRKQDAVDDGEIAVVLVNGDDATIKCYSQQGTTAMLVPKSYNSAHRVQFYDLKTTSVQVIGRVVEIRKRV